MSQANAAFAMRIRKATPDDCACCADIHILARQRMVYLLKNHVAGAQRWMREIVFTQQNVWVAEVDHVIVGYTSLAGGFLTNLYVHPDHQRRGIGSALLAEVKAYAPDGFKLWTFQQNEDAIRFYERHGFRSLTVTDGKDNMERLPDRLMAWQPPQRK
jgi:ribosomal protein S18 acetylase RimI-like enzyme